MHHRPPPKCHPERRHYAKGQCQSCYNRAYYPHRALLVSQQYHALTPAQKADRISAVKIKSLMRWYGLTLDQYHAMFEAQGERCAICREVLNIAAAARAVHVDHDHATKRVRAILCSGCNRGLGSFLENPSAMRAAADYIEHHRAAV